MPRVTRFPGYRPLERFLATPAPWGHLLILGAYLWLALCDLTREARRCVS